MPLLPGKKNIGHNISEMEASGHPYNQARAAALHKAYDAKGGKVKHMSKGGEATASDKSEYSESEKEGMEDKETADLHEGVMKEMGDHLKNGNHKEALESFKALINACHNCKD